MQGCSELVSARADAFRYPSLGNLAGRGRDFHHMRRRRVSAGVSIIATLNTMNTLNEQTYLFIRSIT